MSGIGFGLPLAQNEVFKGSKVEMALTQEQEAFAVGLIDGAQKVFENADRLFYEAGVLADVGAFPRGYLLHQISLEECGKIEILCAAILSHLIGKEVDVKSLSRVFRRHESKNKINAYFLPFSEEEQVAEKNNDIAAAVSSFKIVQEEFHKESNNLKNSSLYVDFDGGFTSPVDVISQDDYERIRAQNATFMGLTNVKVQMLSRWRGDLNGAVKEAQEIFEFLDEEKLGEKPLAEVRDVISQRLKDIARERKTQK
ncbi:AbiV family abortive infection protein [Pseudomonas orientalis]|uniref:AbiV family abortive infection protein n=1 Tax=Pseudomonas orientalis TaxID=76758 RepID=A0A4V2DXN2_9PSED|nr:AbiV family abortive infection protein [Pseudomonas orientalis]RZI31150.1 AbiV family abortive infection protein [Pseudomonas orientalis]